MTENCTIVKNEYIKNAREVATELFLRCICTLMSGFNPQFDNCPGRLSGPNCSVTVMESAGSAYSTSRMICIAMWALWLLVVVHRLVLYVAIPCWKNQNGRPLQVCPRDFDFLVN